MPPWVLALYNAYDPVRWHEAHRRALARAAPLCSAFDAHVAMLGFPIEDIARRMELDEVPRTPREVARLVASTTTIGDDGDHLVELAGAGRLHVLDMPDPGLPPQFGEPVLATRDPDPDKATTAEQLARRRREHRGPFVIVGLGPRGVPKDIRKLCPTHYDVTGRGVSLETATAMGAVVASIAVSP